MSATKRPAAKSSGAARTRTGPKTRQELYEMAKRRDLPGRSSMSRDELARKLGVS